MARLEVLRPLVNLEIISYQLKSTSRLGSKKERRKELLYDWEALPLAAGLLLTHIYLGGSPGPTIEFW